MCAGGGVISLVESEERRIVGKWKPCYGIGVCTFKKDQPFNRFVIETCH